MTGLSVKKRVANGVAWLDEVLPADWPFKLDLDDFDIHSADRCPLGQLEPAAKVSETWKLWDHGFWGNDLAESDALTAEWRRVVRKRLA